MHKENLTLSENNIKYNVRITTPLRSFISPLNYDKK